MTTLTFALLVAGGSFAAGLLGSLTGLGGGIIIVPMLTLLFHVDLRYAIGASLVSVIATSSGAAAAYVREGFTNVRVGILLEVATTIGALIGAALAGFVSDERARRSVRARAAVHRVPLDAAARRARHPHHARQVVGAPSARLDLSDRERAAARTRCSACRPAFAVMFVAGILSALLGIGSGIIKVLAMDQMMRLPFKVSTTTSNFMIGVTAAAERRRLSASRLHRSDARVSGDARRARRRAARRARFSTRANVSWLRQSFTVVVVVMAFEMLYKGITGSL